MVVLYETSRATALPHSDPLIEADSRTPHPEMQWILDKHPKPASISTKTRTQRGETKLQAEGFRPARFKNTEAIFNSHFA